MWIKTRVLSDEKGVPILDFLDRDGRDSFLKEIKDGLESGKILYRPMILNFSSEHNCFSESKLFDQIVVRVLYISPKTELVCTYIYDTLENVSKQLRG